MSNQFRDLKNKTVLVAEDNDINLKVLTILLDKNGLKYQIAKNGEDAVNLFRNTSFSMILMDCQMPIKDGLQASREIRQFELLKGGKKCPIIALTANAMSGDKEKCLSAGVDDFLSKPFNGKDLMYMIQKWMSHTEEVSR